MKADNVEFPGTHNGNNNDADDTQKLPVLKSTGMIGTLEKNSFATDSSKTSSEDARAKGELSLCSTSEVDVEQAEVPCVDIAVEATELTSVGEEIGVAEEAPPPSASDEKPLRFIEPLERSRPVISRGRAILLVAFLVIVILNAVNLGSTQFLRS